MRKKIMLALVAALGLAALAKRRRDAQDERTLWHEATNASPDLR